MDIDTTYNSQLSQGCQVSNAVWDGTHQLVTIKKSAPKYAYTAWVR